MQLLARLPSLVNTVLLDCSFSLALHLLSLAYLDKPNNSISVALDLALLLLLLSPLQ
jgi:hypothetical protein